MCVSKYMSESKKKYVWLATHGEREIKDEKGNIIPDPSMTKEGKDQVRQLLLIIQKFLPNGPTEVHCGTGLRQKQVVECLGYSFDDVQISDVWGGASSMSKVDGKKIKRFEYLGN